MEGTLEQLSAGLQASNGRPRSGPALGSTGLAAELARDEVLGDVLRGDADLDAFEELGFDEDDFLSSLDKNLSKAAKKAAKAAGRAGSSSGGSSSSSSETGQAKLAPSAGSTSGAVELPGLDDGAETSELDDFEVELNAMDAGFGALLKREQERAKQLAQTEEQRKRQQAQQAQQAQKQQKQQKKKPSKLSYVRGDVLSAWADTYKTK